MTGSTMLHRSVQRTQRDQTNVVLPPGKANSAPNTINACTFPTVLGTVLEDIGSETPVTGMTKTTSFGEGLWGCNTPHAGYLPCTMCDTPSNP
jgi:hypothetical protein